MHSESLDIFFDMILTFVIKSAAIDPLPSQGGREMISLAIVIIEWPTFCKLPHQDDPVDCSCASL